MDKSEKKTCYNKTRTVRCPLVTSQKTYNTYSKAAKECAKRKKIISPAQLCATPTYSGFLEHPVALLKPRFVRWYENASIATRYSGSWIPADGVRILK